MESLTTCPTPTSWEAEVVRLTDERHLAAWSHDADDRLIFAGRLGAFLQGVADTEVVRLYGESITGLDDLCGQLERALPPDDGGPGVLRRRVSGPMGIAARLRHQPEFVGRSPLRRRYLIWHDADVLLDRDRALFGAVADAIAGVSAESEYAGDGVLLITRAVFVGGEGLAAYAEDPSGQLRSWLMRGPAEPFWRVVSGLDRPPVLAASIGELLEDPEGLATRVLLEDLDLEAALG